MTLKSSIRKDRYDVEMYDKEKPYEMPEHYFTKATSKRNALIQAKKYIKKNFKEDYPRIKFNVISSRRYKVR